MSLGENIAKRRSLLKIKAIELAERIGIDQSYLSQIENDRRTPRLDILQKIAKELNTTISELLGETVSLDENMVRLVAAAKNLDSRQVDALIRVIKAFGDYRQVPEGNCLVAEGEMIK